MPTSGAHADGLTYGNLEGFDVVEIGLVIGIAQGDDLDEGTGKRDDGLLAEAVHFQACDGWIAVLITDAKDFDFAVGAGIKGVFVPEIHERVAAGRP